MEESGEVKNVRPEEHASRGACADRETEQPLKRSGFGSAPPPEPAGVTNFRRGGEEDSGEDDCRDYGHGETMDGRNGAEWDLANAA